MLRQNKLDLGNGESEGERAINRITNLRGRRGVMTATLVSVPDELASACSKVDELLPGFSFQPGNTYAEFVASEDRLAEKGGVS